MSFSLVDLSNLSQPLLFTSFRFGPAACNIAYKYMKLPAEKAHVGPHMRQALSLASLPLERPLKLPSDPPPCRDLASSCAESSQGKSRSHKPNAVPVSLPCPRERGSGASAPVSSPCLREITTSIKTTPNHLSCKAPVEETAKKARDPTFPEEYKCSICQELVVLFVLHRFSHCS